MHKYCKIDPRILRSILSSTLSLMLPWKLNTGQQCTSIRNCHAHYLHITCVHVQRVDNEINDHTSYTNNEMGGFKKELPNTINQTI